jgi:hypothetical protein
MQRLTTAYKQRDLVALLTLESELSVSSDLSTSTNVLDDETLKVYNTLLQDQIKNLEHEILKTHLNPRYYDIHYHIQDFPKKPLKGIENALSIYNSLVKEYSTRLQNLSAKNPLNLLKKQLSALLFADDDDDDLAFLQFLRFISD